MSELTTSKRYFTFTDDTSNKFWQIENEGVSFTVTYGRIGTSGQSNKKTFDTEEKCTAETAKLVREKTSKGYLEIVNGTAVATNELTAKKPRAAAPGADKEAEERTLQAYNDLIDQSALHQLPAFLKSVDPAHYSALRKRIKAARKHYDDYVKLAPNEGGNNKRYEQWGYRGKWEQRQLIALSGMAMLSRDDLKSFDFISIIQNGVHTKLAHELLEWSRPAWLTDYLNDLSRSNIWQSPDYRELRTWEQKALVQYLPELFARSVSRYNQNWDKKESPQQHIDFLCNEPMVYDRDLPLLFEYETDLHNTAGWVDVPGSKTRNTVPIWPAVFKQLLADEKVDRSWLLEACMSVQSKDWNINLRSFFRRQVEEMKPSIEELIELQATIFQLLGAQHPHVVNWASGLIKEMSASNDFRLTELVDWSAAVWMRSDCKAGIKNLLSIFEKSLKANKENAALLVPALADVFALNDLALQTKAAALTLKYASPEDENVTEKIQLYETQILGTLRTELSAFLAGARSSDSAEGASDNVAPQTYHFVPAALPSLNTFEPVKLPETWNDLLFLIGKFIASDDPIDVELLINAIIISPPDAQITNNEQLQPYIKQLANAASESWIWMYTRAWLLHIIHSGDKPFEFKQQWQTNVHTLHLHKERLRHAQAKRQAQSRLPLLSLPTHAPHWIDATVLLQRLNSYQATGEPVEQLDLAIAIARLHPDGAENALPLCESLEAPLDSLMRFVLTGEGKPEAKKPGGLLKSIFSGLGLAKERVDLEMVWAVAARTRQPQGIFESLQGYEFAERPNAVQPFEPEYKMKEKWNEYRNYVTKEMERTPSWYELNLSLPDKTYPASLLLYSNDLFRINKENWYYGGLARYDVAWWYSLVPQAPESLFAMVVQYGCPVSNLNHSGIQGLHIMLQPHFQFGRLSLLALACGLMAEKRETRSLAAEVLIQHLGEQSVDIWKVGQKAGWLLGEHYAPVQRFSECIQLIKDVSPLHNKGLAMMLTYIFLEFAKLKELPKNTKKLLEIYLDLLVRLGEQPTEEVEQLLALHKSSGTLKNVIQSLTKLSESSKEE